MEGTPPTPTPLSLVDPRVVEFSTAAAMAMPGEAPPEGLAEVKRVRQFFPETWIWRDITTDESGRAVIPVEAPDSITTWMLRAVGMSKEHGLGIGEGQLRVFQPFFLTVDLPFSAIRGEEFPIKIALFNYLEARRTPLKRSSLRLRAAMNSIYWTHP